MNTRAKLLAQYAWVLALAGTAVLGLAFLAVRALAPRFARGRVSAKPTGGGR
jgi:hypothetical protein